MLKNFVKIATRNLTRNKFYTIINVGGLAISIAVCTLILLFVQSEISYDDYHPNKENLYRIALERIYPDHVSEYAYIPAGIAPQAYIDFPEVESFVRVFKSFNEVNIQIEDRSYLESRFMAADSNFFEIFGIKLIQGDPEKVFDLQNGVVLTESTAKKYFGDEQAMGKTLKGGFGDLIVTGISQDVPENTHFKYDLLTNIQLLGFIQQPSFISFTVMSYITLQEGYDSDNLTERLDQIVETYAAGQIERNQGISFEDYKAAGNGYNYYLQPIQDIHLKSHLEAEAEPNGNITYIYIFISISVFVLALAAVNFINLATARSTERAKEVGIRKVLGSFKKQLVQQFLVESILVSVLGTLIGIGLVFLALPYFNELAQKQIEFDLLSNVFIIPGFVGFALFIGLVAGVYPAFVLSTFNPAVVLKGKVITGQKGAWIRNGLVVFQFGISITLICCTLIVNDQMQYLQNKELGFDRENTLVVKQAFSLPSIPTFQERIKNIPGVQGVGASSAMPGDGVFFGASFRTGASGEGVALNCAYFDDDYIETMGMTVTQGRGFSKDFKDSLYILINEAAISALGLQGDPIGQRVTQISGNGAPGTVVYQVVGVLKNYNYKSLHTEITPMAIFSTESANSFTPYLPVKIQSNDLPTTLVSIEAIWSEMSPNVPFTYNFLDENLDQLYAAEQRSGYLFVVFTAIAISIACVGLFGLAAYIVGNRVKEIGIRKVLGASSKGVVFLLLKDFNKLVIISIVLALPVTVLIMNPWLEGFAYYQSIQWQNFLLAGLIALVIAWGTVSYQSIKAAIANPIKALRSE